MPGLRVVLGGFCGLHSRKVGVIALLLSISAIVQGNISLRVIIRPYEEKLMNGLGKRYKQ